ncbi:MAG: hypothetical protein LBI10_06425 [Deltaproteobacteria bacterium]|nr:hypothetical protein [Deltaproteobacteria bacterium]
MTRLPIPPSTEVEGFLGSFFYEDFNIERFVLTDENKRLKKALADPFFCLSKVEEV